MNVANTRARSVPHREKTRRRFRCQKTKQINHLVSDKGKDQGFKGLGLTMSEGERTNICALARACACACVLHDTMGAPARIWTEISTLTRGALFPD